MSQHKWNRAAQLAGAGMVAASLVLTREGDTCLAVAPLVDAPPPERVKDGEARLPSPAYGHTTAMAQARELHRAIHPKKKRKKRHRRHRQIVKPSPPVQHFAVALHGHGDDPLAFGALPAPAIGAPAFVPPAPALAPSKPKRRARPAPPVAPQQISADHLPEPNFGLPRPPLAQALSSPPVAMPAASKPELPAAGKLELPKPQFGQAPKSLVPLSSGDCATTPRFTTDDELIFQIDTQRHEMSDTIIGYQFRGQTFLPLGEVARFLDLAVTVSDNGHYASGWVLDPKKTIAVNLRDHTVTIDGVTRKLQSCDAAAFDGELYLNAARFADLFPLTLGVSLRGQSVTVKTTRPFPYEERAARDEAREHLAGRRSSENNGKRWPHEDTPWVPVSFPLGDLETRAVADSAFGARVENDLRLAGDLAWLTSKLFVSTSTRYGVTGAHVEMGRRDSTGRLLGPLKASDFRFGDISTAPLPLGLGTASGRGAMVTNAPLERASVFDTIDFKGDLPTGYEVELYRNGLLVGSTKTPVDGQYQFARVPVDFGLNLFRLVFYGPQGQRREVVRQVSVGDGRLAKGEFIYNVGALQKGINLLNIQSPNFLPGQDYGAWRGAAQVQYGLTSGLTLAGSVAGYQSLGQNHWLAGLGLRTGVLGVAVKLDGALADRGGRAAELSLGGRLAGFSYKLTHAEYGGPFSDEVRSYTAEPLRRASEVSVNGAIRIGGGSHPLAIPTYGFARQITFADGHELTNVTLHQSVTPFRGWMMSNSLDYSRTLSVARTSNHDVTGSFDLATMSGSRTNFRGTLSYGLAHKAQVTSAQIEVNHRIDDQTMLRAGLGQLIASRQTVFSASAVRRFERFTLAMDGNYVTGTNQYSAMLRLSFGFGRNPFSGALFMAPPGLSNGGAAAIRAFRDNNGNGLYDAGDAVIPGVAFNTGTEHALTDKEGTAFLGRLGDGLRTNYQVDSEALPDVSLAPVTKGVEIAPRAGRIHVSNFAIQALSEIDGTAYFVADGRDKAVSGLTLLLIDSKGKRVARTRTTSDGGFWFEQVRGGDYTLALDAGQAGNLKIRLLGDTRISVGNKGQTLRQVVRVEGSEPGGAAAQ